MLNEKSLHIRAAELKDVEFIKAIEIECGLSPWSRDDYVAELARADSIFIVAEYNSMIIGFLLARLITNHSYGNYVENKNIRNPHTRNIGSVNNEHVNEHVIEIFNIGVRPFNRRSKVGNRLIAELLEKADKYGISTAFLEVRKSNSSAISFYQSFHFSIIYERKNLYTNPSENGLGMRLDMSIQNNGLDMKCL